MYVGDVVGEVLLVVAWEEEKGFWGEGGGEAGAAGNVFLLGDVGCDFVGLEKMGVCDGSGLADFYCFVGTRRCEM
jgi:hypothetical protein